MIFTDRIEAGQMLANKLTKYGVGAVIYGLPRGGVVVASEVAKELEAPLDLILVRKIGHPSYEEYAIGAVAEGGGPIFNEAEKSFVDKVWLKKTLDAKHVENAKRRKDYFPRHYEPPNVKDKPAIIVDDGIATGLTMLAAVKALKKSKPKKIIVAVPVAPQDSVDELLNLTDEVIVLDNPENFRGAVGSHYRHFPQVDDDEVIEIISTAQQANE